MLAAVLEEQSAGRWPHITHTRRLGKLTRGGSVLQGVALQRTLVQACHQRLSQGGDLAGRQVPAQADGTRVCQDGLQEVVAGRPAPPGG